MAQVTIYLPEQLERRLRAAAKRARKSLSAYIADLVQAEQPSKWPSELVDLYGSCPDLEAPPDSAPDPVEPL